MAYLEREKQDMGNVLERSEGTWNNCGKVKQMAFTNWLQGELWTIFITYLNILYTFNNFI